MDGGYDKYNKAVNNNFSLLEELIKDDDDIQFILFRLQVILINNWFLDYYLYIHKTKMLDSHTTLFYHNHVHIC